MWQKTEQWLLLFFASIFLVYPLSSLAAEETDGQSLGQAANDPTASLMSVQVQNLYSGDYHNLDDESGNTIWIP